MGEHQGPPGPSSAWPFPLPRNMAVLVERSVMARLRPIACVYRDMDDDGFQFIGDGEVTEADAMMVGLEEVYRLDPTIGQLADLPPGWRAVREPSGGGWAFEPSDPELLA